MPLDVVTGTILGTLAGGFFSCVTAVASSLINRRSEDRRHLQSVAVEIATRHYARFCREFELTNPGTPLPPYLFDVLLLHISQIVLASGRMRPTETSLRESYAALETVYAALRDQAATQHQAKK